MSTVTLGQALRAWRERLSPVDVGLPRPRSARRTPGLRREEVAWLAGVSADYLQRLEQDRATPSAAVVDALARALCLTREEADELSRLAGHAPRGRGVVSRHVTPGVQRMVDRLRDVPVAVYDATWDLVDANDLWLALFDDPVVRTRRGTVRSEDLEGNVLWRHFTGGSRIVHADVDAHERSLVSDLRGTALRYPQDPRVVSLVEALVASSPRFEHLWHQPDVARHAGQRKTVTGTSVGDLKLDCDVLTAHDCDVRLVVFTAADHAAAGALDLLRVTGLQVGLLGASSRPPTPDGVDVVRPGS
ncbi:helix-turn-helix domain-containing protein [Pseudokineococcus sp. 1T1Z-3]|uniref:helix-turn-helix domain-containing protein n=1 Tax=Pseudokineococcus sp. 1T1Z-3 TaxID=3132745 RepID=UPI0030AB80D9